MNEQFGVKFLLTDKHELVIAVGQEEAERIAAVWLQAKTNGKHVPIKGIGQIEGHRWDWWVWTGDIVAMHTFWAIAPPDMRGASPWRGSGLN